MNQYSFHYKTRRGTVSIVPKNDGYFHVVFDEQDLGSYKSAEAAADDVSGGHTFMPSDGTDLGELDIPENIHEWEKRLLR